MYQEKWFNKQRHAQRRNRAFAFVSPDATLFLLTKTTSRLTVELSSYTNWSLVIFRRIVSHFNAHLGWTTNNKKTKTLKKREECQLTLELGRSTRSGCLRNVGDVTTHARIYSDQNTQNNTLVGYKQNAVRCKWIQQQRGWQTIRGTSLPCWSVSFQGYSSTLDFESNYLRSTSWIHEHRKIQDGSSFCECRILGCEL